VNAAMNSNSPLTIGTSWDERERLKALVQGHVWAANGQRAPVQDHEAGRATDP
jgi:hypothetical protein